MGKIPSTYNRYQTHAPSCNNKDKCAPICRKKECNRSSIVVERASLRSLKDPHVDTARSNAVIPEQNNITTDEIYEEQLIKELIIIGSGPHALSLLLRLLEPDPDFLTDEVRHRKAEYKKYMRPFSEVIRHTKILSRGLTTLKPKKTKNKKKNNETNEIPPPLSLQRVLGSVQVVDAHGDWLASWKKNFKAIGIPQLRSLVNAHADPFDHRSLEYFAEVNGRDDELVTLEDLTQRDKSFSGPYQVPTTSLFNDFHDALIKSYGINDVVKKGEVLSITPRKDPKNDESIFELKICNGEKGTTTIRSRRCVCALGPAFNPCKFSWEKELENEVGDECEEIKKKILKSSEIIQWLSYNNLKDQEENGEGVKDQRLLIVGGGITSVQLVLRALKSSFFKNIFFIQRSQALQRHFDVENKWMGPKRGKLLENFYAMQMDDRSNLLRNARKGGSIPPELFKELQNIERKHADVICMEEIEISQVEWIDEEFHVHLSDGSTTITDYIWLATGCKNTMDQYPLFDELRKVLPIETMNGLPILSPDLNWSSVDEVDECKWKKLARKRIWCLGALAGLQLGPDALNIVGARHGSVKVANSIRNDMIDPSVQF